MIALKEAVLYSGVDKGENHERGVDLIVLKDAAKVCYNRNQYLRGSPPCTSTLYIWRRLSIASAER